MKRMLIIAGSFAILLGVLIAHAQHYMPFLSDDALISLRYAERLLEGHGLTWTDGQPVEGYSNLLWILLVAALGIFGVDLIDAARILGVAAMSGVTLSALLWYTGKPLRANIWLPLALGLLFYNLAAPVAVWAIGGMEQPLYALLIGVAVPLMYAVGEKDTPSRLLSLSLVLGLLCITRPDGPIFVLAAGISVWLGTRPWQDKRRISLTILVFPVLLYGGQLVFRYGYYGELVPNTALVKLTPSLHHSVQGVKYVAGATWALFPLSAIAIVALIKLALTRQAREGTMFLLTATVLWLCYLVFVGGDIFPAYRHMVPIIVLFTFALIEGASLYLTRGKNVRRPIITAIVALLFVPFTYLQLTGKENRRAVTERWEWDGQVLGLLLKQAFSDEQPVIAVTAAGCLPYWSKLPALDMMGLNDHYLPRHRPPGVGGGLLGHELGDGNYVLNKRPDIICFHTGQRNAIFRSGREMQQTETFYDLYAPVRLRAMSPRPYEGVLWILKDSDRIGIVRTASEIAVPGFLLNLGQNTVCYPNKQGKLVVMLRAGATVGVAVDGVPPGNWDVEIQTRRPERIRSRVQYKDGGLIVTMSTGDPETAQIEGIVLRAQQDRSD